MSTRFPSILAAVGFISLLSAAIVPAAVLVTTSDTAPASSFASSTLNSGGLQWRNDVSSGLRDVGQSFYVPTSLTLDSITLRIAPDAAPGAGALTAAFNVAVYQVASSSGVPTAAAIYTESGTMSGLTGTSSDFGKYVTFNLTDVALTGGNYYAVVLSFPTVGTARAVTWQVGNSSSTYTSGMAIVSTDGSTFSGWGGGSDLVFYATAVPEPGTVLLSLAGLTFLVLRRRPRKV